MKKYFAFLLFSTTFLTASEECSTSSNIRQIVPLAVNIPDVGFTFGLNIGYTLWTAKEDGLVIDLAEIYTPPSPSNATRYGETFYPRFQLRSGFKVGGNLLLDYDGWDIGAQYTWFWNKHNRYSSFRSTGTLSPTLVSGPLGGISETFEDTDGEGILSENERRNCSDLPQTSEKYRLNRIITTPIGKWNNWFNRVDLTLGKGFYLGKHLVLRSFLGVIGAFEKQSFDVRHPDPSSPSSTVLENTTQRFWAVGPYTGCKISYICHSSLHSEVSFFLDGGFSLTLAHYKTNTFSSLGRHFLLSKVYNPFSSIDPMGEFSLGIRLQNFWSPSSDNSSFLLQGAWETQVWFNHNQMILMNRQNSTNNYLMHGLTLKAEVTF